MDAGTSSVSRRHFLKGCAATAVLVGLGASNVGEAFAASGDALSASSTELSALTTQATKNISISTNSLTKGKQFTFTYMPYNGQNTRIPKYKGKALTVHTVQNFAITPDGKYCFTVSECNVGSTIHTLLCRTEMPKKVGAKAQAECKAAMVLDKFGHGEAIDISQPDLSKPIYDIWVACTGKSIPGVSYTFGTEIARLTYDARKDKITKTVKIGNFKKGNTSGRSAAAFDGTPYRLNVSLDVPGNRMMFRIVFLEGGCAYTVYEFKKLNAMLDKLKNGKKLDISKAASLQFARVMTSLIPHGSFQGFATVGNNLFIQGGNKGLGAQIYHIAYKAHKAGAVSDQYFTEESHVKRIITLPNTLTAVDIIHGTKKKAGKADLEVEGLKVARGGSGKFVFRNVWYVPSTIQHSIPVYKFTR